MGRCGHGTPFIPSVVCGGILTERALVGIGCGRSRGVKSEMSAKEARFANFRTA